jgi:effector-binding domain-containing protein
VVTFKEKTAPSIIYDAINIWGVDLDRNPNIKVVTENKLRFSEITQHIKKKDSSYVLNWKIKQVNDSLCSVKVYVSEKNSSLKNRLLIPFTKAPIEKYAVNTITEFVKGFQKYLKTFNIKIDGKDSIPAAFCACKSIITTQKMKASEMLATNANIMDFFRKNDLELKGKPYLQITSWDSETEKIGFDFCFPTKKGDLAVNSEGIFFKEIKAVPALKATYYGNYRYSDRTWNYLINYSEKMKISIQKLPTELFFNDPQQGGNELDWKAEIYMPIAE